MDRRLVIFIILTLVLPLIDTVEAGGLLPRRFELLMNTSVVVVVGGDAPQADLLQAQYVSRFLSDIFGREIPVISDYEADLELLKNNSVIVVGGPVYNHVARLLGLNLSCWFERSGDGWVMYVSGWKFSKPGYGFVDFEKNFFDANGSTYIVWLAGIDRNGTVAAVNVFLKANLKRGDVAAVRLKGNYAVVVFCSSVLCDQQKKRYLPAPPVAPIVYVSVGSGGSPAG